MQSTGQPLSRPPATESGFGKDGKRNYQPLPATASFPELGLLICNGRASCFRSRCCLLSDFWRQPNELLSAQAIHGYDGYGSKPWYPVVSGIHPNGFIWKSRNAKIDGWISSFPIKTCCFGLSRIHSIAPLAMEKHIIQPETSWKLNSFPYGWLAKSASRTLERRTMRVSK